MKSPAIVRQSAIIPALTGFECTRRLLNTRSWLTKGTELLFFTLYKASLRSDNMEEALPPESKAVSSSGQSLDVHVSLPCIAGPMARAFTFC